MNGIAMGLDYSGVQAAAVMAGITMTPALFEDIHVMEHEALTVFAEQRRRS